MSTSGRRLWAGALAWAVAAALLAGTASTQVAASPSDGGGTPPAGAGPPSAAPGGGGDVKDSNQLIAEAVADRVPEYAGVFLTDDEQTLNILLVGPADAGPNERAGRAERAERAREALVRLYDDPSYRSRDLVILPARFSWHELTEWNLRLRRGLFVDGLTSFGIDVRANRIRIGVEDPARHAEGVRHRVAELGIPEDAVHIVGESPVILLHHPGSVTGWHETLVGGLQIRVRPWGVPGHSGYGRCTLGVVAVRGGVVGVITASHCSEHWGDAADGSLIGQSTVDAGSGHGFGRETRDAQWTPCVDEPQRICRWADVAFFARHTDPSLSGHDRPMAMGHIAWPPREFPHELGTYWDGQTTRRLVAVQWGPPRPVGTPVAKVGRTTGRTAGTVNHTCDDFDYTVQPGDHWDNLPAGTRIRLQCQVRTSVYAVVGDSGAPVFRRDFGGTLDATLQGILSSGGWGDDGNFYSWYSPMEHVMHPQELGADLRVCAAGHNC